MNNTIQPRRPHVAVVTGGARGIGAAIAIRLAQDVDTIWVLDRDADAAAQTAARINSSAGNALVQQVDIADPKAVDKAFADVLRRTPAIDCLVNAAGVVDIRDFNDIDNAAWQRVFAVNLFGAHACMAAAYPGLRRAAAPAKIINITSTGPKMNNPQVAIYNASKAGLISLTRSAARAWAPHIHVNCISPGIIATDMWREMDQRYTANGQPTSAERAKGLPIGRVGETREIAEAVAFMADPRCSYMIGEDLNVNGGQSMQ